MSTKNPSQPTPGAGTESTLLGDDMIGTNEIKLNHATMCAALEEYFLTRMVPPPKIHSIDYSEARNTVPMVSVTLESPAVSGEEQ